jgi:hypothetical protein
MPPQAVDTYPAHYLLWTSCHSISSFLPLFQRCCVSLPLRLVPSRTQMRISTSYCLAMCCRFWA